MSAEDVVVEPGHARWAGRTCVVTGGLGFIGSNVVHRLVGLGATVRVIDALVHGHGGDLRNLAGLDVPTLVADLGDERVPEWLHGADLIANLAGQVSHQASMAHPERDLHLNTISHLRFLEAVRSACPAARVVHASTRQVYGRGRGDGSTVDEQVAPEPIDVNGVAKLAGEHLHRVFHTAYGLATTSLRLTNVYGPRQCLRHPDLGVLPVFFATALRGGTLRLFGDGSQRRDCLHVDDVVDAVLAAATDPAIGKVYNVGAPDDHSLAELADIIVAAAGSPPGSPAGATATVEQTPFPVELAAIDVGSIHVGSQRLTADTGWRPQWSFAAGAADTVRFYREHPWYLSST